MYARPHDRAAIERVAVDASVPFAGIWLDAPEETLMARVTSRHDDPSDADVDIIRLQRTHDLGRINWRRLDASTSIAQIVQAGHDHLNELLPDRRIGCETV